MPRKSALSELVKFGVDNDMLPAIQQAMSEGSMSTVDIEEIIKFASSARSRAEKRWSDVGKILMQEEFGDEVVFEGHEWISFRLPGGLYTPDYMYLFRCGKMAFVEVKGSRRQKNYRDARSKLRGVATLNPWYAFYEAMISRGDVTLEKIPPDPGYFQNIWRAL